MYQIYFSWQKLSESVKYKIEAIEIAKEWIEVIKNIRDTNFLLFSADTTNCWNSFNYSTWCIWWSVPTIYNIQTWSYIIYQKNNKWFIEKKSDVTDFNSSKTIFRVQKDNRWLYTQSWWTNFTPIYTREIKIKTSNTWSLDYDSIVKRIDHTNNKEQKIILNSKITNWRK